jgi:hypothetical protein
VNFVVLADPVVALPATPLQLLPARRILADDVDGAGEAGELPQLVLELVDEQLEIVDILVDVAEGRLVTPAEMLLDELDDLVVDTLPVEGAVALDAQHEGREVHLFDAGDGTQLVGQRERTLVRHRHAIQPFASEVVVVVPALVAGNGQLPVDVVVVVLVVHALGTDDDARSRLDGRHVPYSSPRQSLERGLTLLLHLR